MRINFNHIFIHTTLILLLVSCIAGTPKSSKRKKKYGSGSDNSSLTVSVGHGRILHANPIILSNNTNLSQDVNLGLYLKPEQDFITNNQFLIGECESLTNCFEVRNDTTASTLQTTDGKWAFNTSSDEFLQVNTYGHMKKIIEKFQSDLKSINTYAQPNVLDTDIFFNYYTSIPENLYLNNAYWHPSKPLVAFSNSGLAGNASFDPALFTLNFGQDQIYSEVKFAQDPSVIYHEAGHAIIDVLLNLRNVASGVTKRSDLGYLRYDEAGSIGEGLSDYFSYYINQRTHIGEWAVGRFAKQSRPLTESDPIHSAGISTSSDERLSYPQFLTYDPNRPNSHYEDVHYAGQIFSHYLMALTENLMSECSLTNEKAVFYVMYLISETMAELGSLTGLGSDRNANFSINLDSNNAQEWIRSHKPITYRSFSQTFARKQINILSNPKLNFCNNSIYPVDKIEVLLDNYGLLLFKNYNEDGNGETTGHNGPNTQVNSANRTKTDLIKKQFLITDPEVDATIGFIFDEQEKMNDILGAFTQSGQLLEEISNQIEAGLPYNNSNGRISPGEFVGVMLNLYNNSNTTMAGVNFLANDWDHMKNSAPCNTFEDSFPLSEEGAADVSTEGAALVPGDCGYITRNNGVSGTDKVGPACFMQIREDDSTKWVSQEKFRQNLGLEKTKCLAGDTNTENCFIRSPKGADTAFYSKIDPKSTWVKTLQDEQGTPVINTNNLIYFEVSPWVPPGTIFNCRFRASFTNCEDCFSDGTNSDDDYLDYEFSGDKPFKIINFKFTVID